MVEIISLDTFHRWDLAGVDGLALMKDWFGDAVERIAPFQSLETVWQGQPCSLLRLCEGNFRLSAAEAVDWPTIPDGQRVWLKEFNWLAAVALPEVELVKLQHFTLPKPPHRLRGLLPNCAIPARLQGIAVLIWRHQVADMPMMEIHTARADLGKVMVELQTLGEADGA